MARFLGVDETGSARRAGGLRRFLQAEDGSFIIFGMFLMIMMFAAASLGVDFMRDEAQRTRLQATLDRAVLAAAGLDQTREAKSVVLDYFDRAGLGHTISEDDILVAQSLTSRRVEACAELTIGTAFMGFIGVDTLTTTACGGAEESASQTEISLVLDVSGSMGDRSASGATKLADLKAASKTFINMVLCNPTNPTNNAACTVEPGKVSVNLVPYSEQVLAGDLLLRSFQHYTTEHNKSSCVTFDAADFNTTTLTPTAADPLKRTGHFDPWTNRVGDNAGGSYGNNWTCLDESWREITPLGGVASTLRSRIDDLGAFGNTSIDVGMKWGTALLDPSIQAPVDQMIAWHKVDKMFADRPIAWTERGVEKVIVLMTDGVNTDQHYLYDHARSGPSPVWRNLELKNGQVREGNRYSIYNAATGKYWWENERRWEDHPYGEGEYEVCQSQWSWWYGWYQNCYSVDEGEGAVQMSYPDLWAKKPWVWYTQWNWLGAPGSEVQHATKNTRLQAICNAAKDKDITVFTIGFEVTSTSADVLRNCASTPAHYFNVNGLDLSAAFAAIAREISKLRLVN